MSSIVNARLIKIGNSRGIRIPKAVLEQVGMGDEVRVEIESDHLIVRPARTPRQGWDEQFQMMSHHGDDSLLDMESLPTTAWEKTEWQW